MTPEQFDALEKMVRSILATDGARDSSDGGLTEQIAEREFIAEARALLVEQPAKEINDSRRKDRHKANCNSLKGHLTLGTYPCDCGAA